MNIFKDNRPLGIAIGGFNRLSKDAQEVVQHHHLKAIIPNYCIGITNQFHVGDEILEVKEKNHR